MTPVEQLIGWRWGVVEQGQTWMRKGWLKKNAAFDTHSGREAARPPEWIPAGDYAQVADLADWLTDCIDSIEISGPWTVRATGEIYWEVREHKGEQVATGTTIRDALVAAVRAVDEGGTSADFDRWQGDPDTLPPAPHRTTQEEET